jgi:hypothetical protein
MVYLGMDDLKKAEIMTDALTFVPASSAARFSVNATTAALLAL